MSEKTELGVETTEANRVIDALRDKIDDTEYKITDLVTKTDKQLENAYDKSIGVMRASYMMVSGFAQVLGGDMGQIFSSIYGVAVAGITTYQSIAAAMAASGVGTAQAILMTMSLISASVSLAGVVSGQMELAQQVSGLNMAIQGIGSMIGVINF